MNSKFISNIPKVRGNITLDAKVSNFSWFKVGGNADLLFEPADKEDLSLFLQNISSDVDIFVLGGASNILIRDGGIPGVTIKLNKKFDKIYQLKKYLVVGAAVRNMTLSNYAKKNDIIGYEFLSGIPGTIGGAVRMNAGAYGKNISDILTKIEIADGKNGIYQITKDQLKMSYRKVILPNKAVILDAYFNKLEDKEDNIERKITEIKLIRKLSQPVKSLTGGSTFKNPKGFKAWKLIDEAGCRGLSIGGAKVSELHTNFIINYNNASASDIETLGEEVKYRVYNKLGINLEWEIIRIGRLEKEI